MNAAGRRRALRTPGHARDRPFHDHANHRAAPNTAAEERLRL